MPHLDTHKNGQLIVRTYVQSVTTRVKDAASVPVLPTQACRKPLAAEASKPPHVTSANVHMRAAAQGMAHAAAVVQGQHRHAVQSV